MPSMDAYRPVPFSDQLTDLVTPEVLAQEISNHRKYDYDSPEVIISRTLIAMGRDYIKSLPSTSSHPDFYPGTELATPFAAAGKQYAESSPQQQADIRLAYASVLFGLFLENIDYAMRNHPDRFDIQAVLDEYNGVIFSGTEFPQLKINRFKKLNKNIRPDGSKDWDFMPDEKHRGTRKGDFDKKGLIALLEDWERLPMSFQVLFTNDDVVSHEMRLVKDLLINMMEILNGNSGRRDLRLALLAKIEHWKMKVGYKTQQEPVQTANSTQSSDMSIAQDPDRTPGTGNIPDIFRKAFED